MSILWECSFCGAEVEETNEWNMCPECACSPKPWREELERISGNADDLASENAALRAENERLSERSGFDRDLIRRMEARLQYYEKALFFPGLDEYTVLPDPVTNGEEAIRVKSISSDSAVAVLAERDRLRAELARLRPVVEAALWWRECEDFWESDFTFPSPLVEAEMQATVKRAKADFYREVGLLRAVNEVAALASLEGE